MIFKVSRSDRIADGRAETAAAGQDPGSSLRSLDLVFFCLLRTFRPPVRQFQELGADLFVKKLALFWQVCMWVCISILHSVAGSLNIFMPGNVHLEELHLLSYIFSHLLSHIFGSHQSVAKHLLSNMF